MLHVWPLVLVAVSVHVGLIANSMSAFIPCATSYIEDESEAEYVAESAACKDGLSLKYFLGELMQVLTSITIHMDNQCAMFMASNLFTNKCSKYIDLR